MTGNETERMHKILLVDDMRFFLDLETSFLLRADCQVLTASTGLEAKRFAERSSRSIFRWELPPAPRSPSRSGLRSGALSDTSRV